MDTTRSIDRRAEELVAAHDPGSELRVGQSPRIDRQADANGVEPHADLTVAGAASSSGSALPIQLQRQFEGSLGADLSGVRVHTGAGSADACEAVSAKAYTVGSDIHFGEGHYDPASASGQELLAHEVAHTVQQGDASPGAQFKLEVSAPGDAHEGEADRAAQAMVSGQTFDLSPSAFGLSREPDLDKMLVKSANAMGAASNNKFVTDMAAVSTVSDAAAAKDIIGRIQREGDFEKVESRDDFSFYAGENATAVHHLESYLFSLSETTRTEGNFTNAYRLAREDYARIVGMSTAVEDFANTPEEEQGLDKTLNRVGEMDLGVTVDTMPAATSAKLYSDTRGQLATTAANLASDEREIQTAIQDLLGQNLAMKARQAKGDAEEAKAGIEQIKKECDAVAGWAMKVVSIGSHVATLGMSFAAGSSIGTIKTLAASLGEADRESYEQAYAKVGPKTPIYGTKATGKDLAMNVWEKGQNTKENAESHKKLGELKESILGDVEKLANPEALIASVLMAFQAPKINRLNQQVAAAEARAALAQADLAALEISKAQQRVTDALTKMARDLKDFQAKKKNLRTYADAVVNAALGKGPAGLPKGKEKPNLAVAMRFLCEADAFCSQADVAIGYGQAEQAASKATVDKGSTLSSKVKTNDHVEFERREALTYYVWTDKRVNGDVVARKPMGMKADLAGDRYDWSDHDGLEAPDKKGITDRNQQPFVVAIQDLDEWRKQIGGLRASIEAKLGTGIPTLNQCAK